jgi:hypothetical protein
MMSSGAYQTGTPSFLRRAVSFCAKASSFDEWLRKQDEKERLVV